MKNSKFPKTNKKNSSPKNTQKDFLLVGIGASAGGIQALKAFFEKVPAESNLAYIVILHLSPDHDSQLAEILQTVSKIPVTQVTEKVRVEPNHVYVVPPNRSLAMSDGHIVVSEITTVEERRAPVDIFFRTLGESHQERAVAVILSGTGANGSMGIRRIKEKGGATFVQDPKEAEFNEMPLNSIKTELIDEVLAVAEIPARIINYRENLGNINIPLEFESKEEDEQKALRQIFTQLRIGTGHEFSNYKRPTVLRRIERRMVVRNFDSLPKYAEFLKKNTGETQALLKDLLISVTNFFRDKEAFQYLEQEILPRVLHDKKSGDQVRLWVAGCATGEEAYSIAMLIAEQLSNSYDSPEVVIFATDIDEQAIATARNGLYTLNDAADVSPERLKRFFIKEKHGYRVRRELREMVLFASHNLLKDPPFSNLDLVTCRNLLIYFNPQAQERVLETFHFALHSGGYIFLGSAESVNGTGDLYETINRESCFYKSLQTIPRIPYPVPDLSPSLRYDKLTSSKSDREISPRSYETISYGNLHGRILEQFAPPSILVNEKYNIVHVSENAGRYLKIGGGELSSNLFKLIRPELKVPVSTAVYQAVQRKTNVEAENLRLEIDDKPESVNVSVRPVLQQTDDITKGFVLIIFEQTESKPKLKQEAVFDSSAEVAHQLEEELMRSQTQHRTSIEQSEVHAEELKASNEELQAINEELRSTTEELETGKEELQSVNEELVAVNQELKVKIEELSQSNNDLQNLINSTDIGTMFLDRNSHVKLFTSKISKIFNLIPSDIGRSLSDITHKLKYENLINDVETVLDNLKPIEREVHTENDSIYLMQITPYRTSEDRIKGTVIVFINITKQKRQDAELGKLAERIERQAKIFDTTLSTISDFAYTFDKKGRFTFANQPLLELLGITLEEIIGKNFFDLNYPDELAERHQQEIQRVFDTGRTIKAESSFTNPEGLHGFYEYIFNPVFTSEGSVESVVGSTRDITESKYREKNLAFLADFSNELIPLTEKNGIVQTFGEKVSRFVNASACAFFEINETRELCVCKYAWHLTDAHDMTGNYDMREFVNSEFQELMANGQTVIVRNVEDDPRVENKAKFDAIKVGAFVNIPLLRGGEWQFALGIYHDEPYNWQDEEIAVMVESANRIWSKMERIRANQKLIESERRLQVLIENLPGGAVFIVDRDLRYIVAEGKALADADLKPADLIGKTIYESLPAEMASIYEDYYQQAFAGETFVYEHKSHGRTYISHGNPLRSADGEVHAALAVSYDITDRKITEEKLRKSKQWLSLIMESVKDYAIITTDTNGIVNGWNPGAEKMFGYTEREIVGKNSEVLFTPEDRENDAAEKEMQTAIKNQSAEVERYQVRKDGSRFFVSGLMHPIKDGKIDGFVKIARDITERIKTEAIKRDKKMLQKLVGAQEDERRRIARDLHDELGQLLTALRLQLEAARNLCEDEEEICIKIAESQMLAKKVDYGIDFLAWELRPAALDDFGLYSALGKYVREWTHYSGVSAELLESGIKKSRFIREIETNLYRITQESLNNVYKHAEATHVEIVIEKRDDTIVLIIEDNGIGFEPEKKLNRTKGIGLIGMKERAALVGGNLEIESSPGKGTTIFARVPTTFTKQGESND